MTLSVGGGVFLYVRLLGSAGPAGMLPGRSAVTAGGQAVLSKCRARAGRRRDRIAEATKRQRDQPTHQRLRARGVTNGDFDGFQVRSREIMIGFAVADLKRDEVFLLLDPIRSDEHARAAPCGDGSWTSAPDSLCGDAPVAGYSVRRLGRPGWRRLDHSPLTWCIGAGTCGAVAANWERRTRSSLKGIRGKLTRVY